jgi:hypothetical protein
MASSSFPPAVTPDEPEGDLAKEKAGRKDTNPPIELSRFRLGSARGPIKKDRMMALNAEPVVVSRPMRP